MGIRPRHLVRMLLVAIPLLIWDSVAQAVEIEIEGPISAVTVTSNNGTPNYPLDDSGTISVMGVTVLIPAGIPITSPTASLTISQIADPTPFHGRSQPGFIGGTAIITGTTFDGITIMADTVFVEPAENVMLGMVTANSPNPFMVNGVVIQPIADSRIPSRPPANIHGFLIDLATVPVGSPVSLEGYFGADKMLHTFVIEADGGALVSNAPAVSITRARCVENGPASRNGDTLTVRGSVTMTHTAVDTQLIRIIRVDAHGETILLDAVTAVRDPEAPNFALFDVSMTTPRRPDPDPSSILGTCPTVVKAVNTSPAANLASAEASVSLR